MSENYYDRRSPEYAGRHSPQETQSYGVLIIAPWDYWKYLPRGQWERAKKEHERKEAAHSAKTTLTPPEGS